MQRFESYLSCATFKPVNTCQKPVFSYLLKEASSNDLAAKSKAFSLSSLAEKIERDPQSRKFKC